MKAASLPRARDRHPKPDPHYAAAKERARLAAERLRRAGIIDSEGRRVRTDLPPDMREGQDRDYGG